VSAPAVVCLGGGHGAAAALSAARRYGRSVSAVISVADDGGSSGRLRELFDLVAVGDLRRCLVALAADPEDAAALFEHRFSSGELAGHPVGNLLLAGLIEGCGDLLEALRRAGAMLGCCGQVLPATVEPVVLRARGSAGEVVGQSAIAQSSGIEAISLDPADPAVPAEVLSAIAAADQVLLGPGSLYTSVLAAAAPPAITDAIAATSATRIYLANLRPQVPETTGYSVADHLGALERHGIAIDVVLCDPSWGIEVGTSSPRVQIAQLTAGEQPLHDPAALAAVLSALA